MLPSVKNNFVVNYFVAWLAALGMAAISSKQSKIILWWVVALFGLDCLALGSQQSKYNFVVSCCIAWPAVLGAVALISK